jgi:hypothetical protein
MFKFLFLNLFYFNFYGIILVRRCPLKYEEARTQALKRLSQEPNPYKLRILFGCDGFTVNNIISEIERDTETGREFVEAFRELDLDDNTAEKKWIPGHVKAYTWFEALLAGLTAWFMTNNVFVVIAVELVVVGHFVGNHTTHLKRHHDEGQTWTEKKMLRYPRIFRGLGATLFVLGFVIIFLVGNIQYKEGFEAGRRAGYQDGVADADFLQHAPSPD